MKPIKVKAMTIFDVADNIKKRVEENECFVKETGLCFACKKNKADPDGRCQECKDKEEKALRGLRGESGFMEMRIGKQDKG